MVLTIDHRAPFTSILRILSNSYMTKKLVGRRFKRKVFFFFYQNSNHVYKNKIYWIHKRYELP